MDIEPTRPFNAATTVEHSPGGNDGPRPLEIDAALLDALVAHLRASLPNEGCGLLAGVPGAGVDRVVHFFPGTNIDHSPVRYTMDPLEVIVAMKRMREESWQFAAIVHSHPRTAPVPSRTDQKEWYYREARLLIVSFEGIEPEIRCWELAGDREGEPFRLAPLLILPAIDNLSGRSFPVSLIDGTRRFAGRLRALLNRFCWQS